MRFIETTSREFTIEDVIRNGGAPNYKWWWLETQRRFKFFLISNLSIEMSYYKGGHNKLAKVCNQVLNLTLLYPHLLSQDNQLFNVSPLLSCLVRQCRTWRETLPRLNWPLGVGGIYTFPIPLQRLFFHLCPADRRPTALSSFSLFSIGDLKLPSIPLWFSHQSLREKATKLD